MNSARRGSWAIEELGIDEERPFTLFPTRLREFEEKNNLIHKHIKDAKQRRNSDCPRFGDQFCRRGSVVQEDLIDDDELMYNAMRNIFRRGSVTADSMGPSVGGNKEVMETRLIPVIFARLGQEYEVAELQRWIKANDRHGLGVVDFNGYQRILVHFLKDPESIAKAKTEEFSFQNLIRDASDSDMESESEENSE